MPIFAENVEEEAYKQIMSMASHPYFKGTKIRIMPDTHAGKGCTIGTSYPITDFVNPSNVGVDIGCSVSLWLTDAIANPKDYAEIERRIKRSVPLGFNIHHKTMYDEGKFHNFLRNRYEEARSKWNDMVLPDFDFSEKGIAKWCQKLGMDLGVFYHSIGTVGGGNHYIEVGVDKNGHYAVSYHCGSRNLGVKVCKYWENKAKGGIDKSEFKHRVDEAKSSCHDKTKMKALINDIKLKMEQETAPTGFLTGLDMKGYITDMVIAQAYAMLNHKVIGGIIKDEMVKVIGPFNSENIYTTHNYINMEDHILRKGAVYAGKDVKFVLPFNMRDGLAVCVGKGNEDWNCTAPHGAGRLMSRTEAKKTLSMEIFKQQMSDITTTSVCPNTLDESPMAYKSMESIVRLVEPTCEIIEFIKPVINIKATDGME